MRVTDFAAALKGGIVNGASIVPILTGLGGHRVDRWRYYAITHRDHAVLNPTSANKLDEMIALFDLTPKSRVLDIGCGKGEMLIRIAQRYGCAGVGVDLSPHFISDARERVAARVLAAQIELI